MKLTCQFCTSTIEIDAGHDFHQQLNRALWTQIDIDMFSCGKCARQVLQPLSPNPADSLSPDEQNEIEQSRLDYMERYYGKR